MKRCVCLFVATIFINSFSIGVLRADEPKTNDRETVLDRKVHIEKKLILDIPKVSCLCDEIGIRKQWIDVGDCGLHCEEEGEGMPIVLLHGGPGATHQYFHPHFSRAKDFAKIIYYDQRGCGISEYKKGKGYSIDQAVDDLEKLREELNIKKWVILGHSYGGTLAQCYAVKYPERVLGLVLVCSGTYGLPLTLEETREYDFMSQEEKIKIQEIYRNRSLSLDQKIFNAHLNGDWKRQNFYRPSREQLARMALYEWKHGESFRDMMCESLNSLDLKGSFDKCPLPIFIMEGKWDLTWSADKPEKFHTCFPGSKLEMFERSGHSPFGDEPEKFFAVLKVFIGGLSELPEAEISGWKAQLTKQKEEKKKSPAYLLKSSDWGLKSNEKIANSYSKEWLEQLNNPILFLKVGFALYDVKRYEESLGVFRKMSEVVQANKFLLSVSFIWQGHMLDLLGRRDEAILLYRKVVDMKIRGTMQHSQYDFTYSPSAYANKRLNEPFSRIENQYKD